MRLVVRLFWLGIVSLALWVSPVSATDLRECTDVKRLIRAKPLDQQLSRIQKELKAQIRLRQRDNEYEGQADMACLIGLYMLAGHDKNNALDEKSALNRYNKMERFLKKYTKTRSRDLIKDILNYSEEATPQELRDNYQKAIFFLYTLIEQTTGIGDTQVVEKYPYSVIKKPALLRQLKFSNKCLGCDLSRANLTGANLDKANLTRANLIDANLVGATLTNANLERANLERAQMGGAHLAQANLAVANLKGANLARALMWWANLKDANLERTDLPKADLSWARLPKVNLDQANLAGANLKGANLKGANLKDANLKDANLEKTNLTNANLSGANLSGAFGKRSSTFCNTTMPDNTINNSGCDSEIASKETPKKGSPRKSAEPTVKTAKLTVRSNVRGDKVYIDGKYKGSTRLDLDLPKGRHIIRIEKDGYKTYEEQIDLSNALTLRASLEKIAEKPVQTVSTDDTSVEVTFWKTIQGSSNADVYKEYLRQFPDGVYAGLARIKIKELTGASVAKTSIPNLDYGRYHALVIGNDHYRHLDNLQTARNDAKAIANVLKQNYGFEVTLLSNATRSDMFKALENYRRKTTKADNLLIYYAGHGYLDKEADEGFWLPVDAEENSQLNWIPNADIIRSVSTMNAKHVMVVADSCFSGTLTRGITIREKTPDYLQRISKQKARVAITSGGEEPVTDVGAGGHSAFANAFLYILRQNTEVMDSHDLYTQLRHKVMINTDQTPRYGDMRGHEDGDFLFVRQ